MGQERIGLGGGCHWCTEAIFMSLRGVEQVMQGWIASEKPWESFSEAVIVHFDPELITLSDLLTIHLHTHSATSQHAMRQKYRSAVYYESTNQKQQALAAIDQLQASFDSSIITLILPLVGFRSSPPQYRNYYYTNRAKPFCQTYIRPKLNLLMQKFSKHADAAKILNGD